MKPETEFLRVTRLIIAVMPHVTTITASNTQL